MVATGDERDPGRASAEWLTVHGLTRRFGPVAALAGVSLRLAPGEILALLGENGAGKSTLIRCISGAIRADAGEIRLGGVRIAPASPREAEALGISAVHQEVNLVPHLSIAENICLGREPTGALGLIRWREMRARARAALERLGLGLDVRRELSTCPVAIRQLIAVARALDTRARVLILDEPTSSLDRREVASLFGVLRRLRTQGLSMIFITHFLDQVYELCDRCVVLRDGRLAGEAGVSGLARSRLVSMMVGKEVAATVRAAEASGGPTDVAPLLEARSLSRPGAIDDVGLRIAPGEVVGLAGLLGSGRTETARALSGAVPAVSGEIRWRGEVVTIRSPRRAIALGIAMTPEDRARDGLCPGLSVRENILVAIQARAGWRAVPRARARSLVEELSRRLGVKAASLDVPVGSLSGGNQQKVLLARWLAAEPTMLILDEPTRGIDIAGKADIMALVAAQRRRGVAVLFISSELEEVLAASDRVVVLRERRSIAEFDGERLREADVLAAMAGSGGAGPAGGVER